MINLMPDDIKRELRAARTNVLLVRYMIVISFAALFLLFVLAGSLYLLNQTKLSSQQFIDANDTKAEVFSSTKAQVEALSASLSEARGILDQEILYSNVLINFAQQMPSGAVIDKLTLDGSSFSGTPLTMTVYARTTNDALAVQDRFKSSSYFSDVTFQTVSDSSGGIDGYPVSATLTLTLNRSITQ